MEIHVKHEGGLMHLIGMWGIEILKKHSDFERTAQSRPSRKLATKTSVGSRPSRKLAT